MGTDLKSQTSESMMAWNLEVFTKVQVDGGQAHKRRTFYPNGKPSIVDLLFTPIDIRIATGEHPCESQVLTLSLVQGKNIDLNDEAMV